MRRRETDKAGIVLCHERQHLGTAVKSTHTVVTQSAIRDTNPVRLSENAARLARPAGLIWSSVFASFVTTGFG